MSGLSKNSVRLFWLSAAIIIIAVAGGHFSLHPTENIPVAKIKKNFTNAQKTMIKTMSDIALLDNDSTNEETYIHYFDQLNKQQGQSFFYRFQENRLRNWSSNALNISPDLLKIPDGAVIEYDHNILQIFKKKTKHSYLLGILVIRRDYYVHNKYLYGQNNLGIPENVTIDLTTGTSGKSISNLSGQPVFSLVKNKNFTEKTALENLFFFLFLIGFFLLLTAILRFKNKLLILAILGGIWLLRLLSLGNGFPEGLYRLALFQPFTYSFNSWMFSLGDTLINVILILFSFLLLKRFLPEKFSFPKFVLPANILLLAIAFELVFMFLKSLIFDSNLNFLFFSLTAVNANQFFALLAILILLIAFYHLSRFLLGNLTSVNKIIYFLSGFFGGSGLFIYQILRCSHCWITGMVIGIGFVLFLWTLYFLRNKKPTFSFLILSIGLIALSLSTLFFFFSEKKDDATKRLLVVKLANDRDFIAESLLPELGKDIRSDSLVSDLLFNPKMSLEKCDEYLTKKYFQGFWNNFDFQVTICDAYDSLNILENSEVVNCFSFFDELKRTNTIQLSDTNFYFLDNNNGRNSYLGILPFYRNGKLIRLFLEIDSKLISVKLGYPKLLINGKNKPLESRSKFFYAKYKNGRLIAQLGDFAYPIIVKNYLKALGKNQFAFLKTGKFKHLIYQKDSQTVIVLTSPRNSFWEFVIEFSYLFLFGVVMGILITISGKKDFNEWFKSLNFKRRIQLTILGTLFIFFVIVGTLTAFFIYYQLQEKFQEEMSERIESVRVELTHKIASFPKLTVSDENYLNPLLTKFSTVFLTDIHLFSPEGKLVGTSRPQIFNKDIEGEMMDVAALQALKIEKVSKFVHTEKIGKLQFLSAYIPFFNDRNQLIAYLNLPYFTRQSEITQQLSQIVITIINVFIFLILISFLAVVVIAEQLTKPLAVIREHIQQLQFGGKNKPISYSRRDEIGDLITEYNRMVDELEKNAEILAQSERESAWRDMAKQVAHEIKNPLTPMKLSVQHLQKTWKSHTENLDDFINHTTENLIEQIDNLTVIANEFSHFAKMPQAKRELFKPAEKLKKVIQLFKDNPNYELTFTMDKTTENIQIEMDKEQFTIVFNNLIKNAVQSIPPSLNGKISVVAKIKNDWFLVEVSDNGIGIPAENQSKIFTPNFTTKTSGMGIGLSIVKTIMDNVGGEISFDSEQGKGTRFYLRFPVS